MGFQFQYFVWCQNCTAETFNFHALRLIFIQFVYNCTLAVPEAGKVCHRAKPETLAAASAKHLVFLVWGWRHLGRGGLNAPSALRPETPKTLGQTLGEERPLSIRNAHALSNRPSQANCSRGVWGGGVQTYFFYLLSVVSACRVQLYSLLCKVVSFLHLEDICS